MCCVGVCYKGEHISDGCELVSTSCKYDFRKSDLFVLNWARVRQVMRQSVSSEPLMCGCGSPFSPCSVQSGSLASR